MVGRILIPATFRVWCSIISIRCFLLLVITKHRVKFIYIDRDHFRLYLRNLLFLTFNMQFVTNISPVILYHHKIMCFFFLLRIRLIYAIECNKLCKASINWNEKWKKVADVMSSLSQFSVWTHVERSRRRFTFTFVRSLFLAVKISSIVAVVVVHFTIMWTELKHETSLFIFFVSFRIQKIICVHVCQKITHRHRRTDTYITTGMSSFVISLK